MQSDDSEDTNVPARPQTWAQRNAVTILTVTIFTLLALVMAMQMVF